MKRDPFEDPRVGDKFRVYDAIVTVKYSGHGAIVLTRNGKFDVQMTYQEFENWVRMKQPELVCA